MTTQLPIPKERLERVIELTDVYDPGLTKALARFALAAYEQELVAMRCKLKFGDAELNDWHYSNYRQPDDFERRRCIVEFLYTHPAPSIPTMPAGLHPDTQKLVADFSTALAEKLYKAQLKNGIS